MSLQNYKNNKSCLIQLPKDNKVWTHLISLHSHLGLIKYYRHGDFIIWLWYLQLKII